MNTQQIIKPKASSVYKKILNQLQKNVSKSPLKQKITPTVIKVTPIQTEKKENLKRSEIQFANTMNKENKSPFKYQTCLNHPNKKAKYYNQNQKKVLCSGCAISQYQKTDKSIEKPISQRYQKTIQPSASKLEISLNSFHFSDQENLEENELQESNNQFDKIFKQQQKLIEKNFDNLILQLLNQKKQALEENRINFQNLSRNLRGEEQELPKKNLQLFDAYLKGSESNLQTPIKNHDKLVFNKDLKYY